MAVSPHTLLIAHAGGAGLAPENTLAAIRASLTVGVDAIEVDVHATADAIPVLIHDATVDRTTDGTGAVASLTLAEIKALDAGSHLTGGAFKGERIPTLAEALQLTHGRVPLFVEIKPPGIEEAVVRVLRTARALSAESAWICSFRRDVVLTVQRLESGLPCYLTASDADAVRPAALDDVAALGLSGLSAHFPLVDEAVVAEARRRGLRVLAWTVDDPAEARRLRSLGVDGIITNVPHLITG